MQLHSSAAAQLSGELCDHQHDYQHVRHECHPQCDHGRGTPAEQLGGGGGGGDRSGKLHEPL